MFPLPLVVTFGPSPALRRGLIVLHLLAASALAVSALAPAWQLACALALCLSAWRCTRRRPPLRLRCGGDGTLAQATAAGWQQRTLGHPLVVLPLFVLLPLRKPSGGPAHWLLIPADSMDAQEFRRLRLWLRWRAQRPDRQKGVESA
jgi:toxin CptA